MKCKNCGAELTMLEKFCPNCGTPNEQSQQHIKDMEHYEHEFSDTQKEVVRNSKWFIKYIAPVTSLVIAGIAAVIVTIQANHLWDITWQNKSRKNIIRHMSRKSKNIYRHCWITGSMKKYISSTPV